MKTVVLIVLDGWGIGPNTKANPLGEARVRTFEKMVSRYPSFSLAASGIAVGLPWGEPGNSEAGHLTIGAGKIVYQHLPRITLEIRSGAFFKNRVLENALAHAKTHASKLHIMGLLSSGTVHSSMDHLFSLLELAAREKLQKENCILHLFTDGRDSPPTDAKKFVHTVQKKIESFGVGVIGSLIGRYYALDRNAHWERTKKAYTLLTEGQGEHFENPITYLEKSYANNITDEFIEPGISQGFAPIRDGDAVIFFDYREDSTRQLTKAFVTDPFPAFPRRKLNNLFFAAFTEYEKGLPLYVAFPSTKITHPLGKILQDANVKQFRVAETEKYAHITYFFNGLRETPFDGEERILLTSLPSSHLADDPAMRAETITEILVEKITSRKYGFLLANFANADMVAHTGNFEAAKKTIEVLDRSIRTIWDAIAEDNDTYILITGDHGNIDEMLDLATGEVKTEHTANPVPLYILGKEFEDKSRLRPTTKEQEPKDLLFLDPGKKEHADGTLADVAPTVLDLLDIQKPDEMSGESLLKRL